MVAPARGARFEPLIHTYLQRETVILHFAITHAIDPLNLRNLFRIQIAFTASGNGTNPLGSIVELNC
jgi:hypothetical protein